MLINHTYKILSVILLGRLTADRNANTSSATDRPDSDLTETVTTIYYSKVLYDNIISGTKNFATFINVDYAAAFDSVSHKYKRPSMIDDALTRAGPSRKTRSVLKQI